MRAPTGWEFFDKTSARLIERGVSTAEAFNRHLEGKDGTPSKMKSYEHYTAWREKNPGGSVPKGIGSIRTDAEFGSWAALGFPE